MLIKETYDQEFKREVKIAVSNNFRDCDFDEEIDAEGAEMSRCE